MREVKFLNTKQWKKLSKFTKKVLFFTDTSLVKSLKKNSTDENSSHHLLGKLRSSVLP